jgi:ABC-type nitrate/sulfonate/bicarbonate transport system substrate-binding protein
MTHASSRRLSSTIGQFAAAAGLLLVLATEAVAQEASRPLRVYGNTTTIELAPVLLAADRIYKGPVTVTNGGIPNLFNPGEADIATNADTQALRQSVDHPNLRIIFTVSEGFYRVVARRSAGITKLADLRGKKIATVPRTSSAYYLFKMLGTVGLTEADVTIVPMVPLNKIPPALKKGEIDAVTVWEPEIQLGAEQIGADAIEFQDRSVYRELFNLNTTAENLANPVMRRQIVAFVRALIKASASIRREPQEVWPLVSKASGYDTAVISRVWHHEGYPGTMVHDLLDVLVEEEVWSAKERNRTPRTREQLATLVDDSVLKEALEQERAEAAAATVSQRLDRLASRVEGEEAIRAVKRIQHAYTHYAEAGRWDDLGTLFATYAVSTESGTVRAGREAIQKHLSAGLGGGRTGLLDGELNTVLFLAPVITLNPGGQTAKGRWHAMFMRGKHGSSATWAGGIYENEYARENGVWKISKENYFPQYAGPYDTGWRNVVSASGAQPALVPYHYTPDRVGTPIPDAVPARASSGESLSQRAKALADLERRSRQLNDASAVLNLQNAWGFYVDRKMWDDAADLFAANGTLELEQQGVYVGGKSIRRALDQFGPPGLKAGEVNDHLQLAPVVTVAADGRTAKARGTQLSMTGVNNVGAQWGTAIYENTYVKDGGVWKIASMHVYPRMKTDYAKGWAKDAQPAAGPSKEYPSDRRPTKAFASFPSFFVPAIHFQNPAGAATASRNAAPPARTQAELETRLAEAERLVAVAEAFDGAENVSNAYGYYIDEFVWHDTSDLFAVNGQKELSYIGNYVGRERIRKSMITRYGNGGRRGVFMAIHQKTQPFVSVAPDGQSARIRTRLFQINSQAEGDGSYIAGIYENKVVREDGVWKIGVMDLDYVWTTGYKAGWAGVKPGDARTFAPTTAFPFPPDGPLRGVAYAPFPEINAMAFHFANPVSGREPPVMLK